VPRVREALAARRPGAVLIWLAGFLACAALAAEKPTRVFKHRKSACQVRQFGGGDGGDYPTYQVFKRGKPVHAIDCDCSVSVLFSPSGKYIAFGNSEMDSFERKGNLLVYNCETGRRRTYLPPSCSAQGSSDSCAANVAEPRRWSVDEKRLSYRATVDGKERDAELVFDGSNPRP
jgi:hypothetical protein